MDDGQARKGRPTKFNEGLVEKIAQLAKAGKTDRQIAYIIGVSPRTLSNWKGHHPDLLHALKESKQIADELVEASLFNRAVGYSHPAVKIFASQGAVFTEKYIEHYPPDTTAAIFWLKNRQPDKWRDKRDVELSGTVQEMSDNDLDLKIAEKLKALRGET